MQIRFFFIIIFWVTACTPEAIPTSIPTLNPSNLTTTISVVHPTMTPNPFTPFPSIQILIEKATKDLAQRLSIPVAQIHLVETRDVVWPDTSLGCPQKGMVYADVLTQGFLIILAANNKEYEYHSSKGTELVYCENPNPPIQSMPGDT